MALGTLIKLIDRPSEAMQNVVNQPKSWWLPAVMLLLSAAMLVWVSVPYTLQIANERAEQTIARITSSMDETQAENVRENARPMTQQRMLLTTGITLLLTIPLGWALRGGLIHFTSMAMGGTSAWRSTFAAGLWSMMPFFVRDLLQAAWILTNKAAMMHAGLSFLVASGDWMADSQALPYLILSQVDPFVLWHLILLTAAIAVATKIKRGQSAVLAFVIWLIISALKIVPSLIGAAMMG